MKASLDWILYLDKNSMKNIIMSAYKFDIWKAGYMCYVNLNV